GEQQGQELHPGEDAAADGKDRREHRAVPSGYGYRRPRRTGSSGAEEGPAAREDRGAEGADAAPQGARGANAGQPRSTAVADRSRCALDEEPRLWHRRLQRADGGGYQEPSDRGARSRHRGHRSRTADTDG